MCPSGIPVRTQFPHPGFRAAHRGSTGRSCHRSFRERFGFESRFVPRGSSDRCGFQQACCCRKKQCTSTASESKKSTACVFHQIPPGGSRQGRCSRESEFNRRPRAAERPPNYRRLMPVKPARLVYRRDSLNSISSEADNPVPFAKRAMVRPSTGPTCRHVFLRVPATRCACRDPPPCTCRRWSAVQYLPQSALPFRRPFAQAFLRWRCM